MFTGIVEELGEVLDLEPLADDAARLTVRGATVVSDAGAGDSIAVNGVCLTVVRLGTDTFTADVMRETLRRSTLGTLTVGASVNLERAVAVGDRLGGHIVQGHVDGVGVVLSRRHTEHWDVVEIALPAALGRYVVEKGSIALDGVSLTVSGLRDGDERAAASAAGGGTVVSVSLIPATLAHTTMGTRAEGDGVNVEVDVLAKHVERLLDQGSRAEIGGVR